jgi:hypothetical protein
MVGVSTVAAGARGWDAVARFVRAASMASTSSSALASRSAGRPRTQRFSAPAMPLCLMRG